MLFPFVFPGPCFNFPVPEVSGRSSFYLPLGSAQATLTKVDKSDLAGTSGKCKLCGTKTDLYPVELHIPNFKKGAVKEDAMLCEKCLVSAGQAFAKFKREEAAGHGHH